jgi:predicted ATPase
MLQKNLVQAFFPEACYSSGRMIFLRSIERTTGEPESYTNTPFAIPRLVSLRSLVITSPVVFLTGENGSGQSSLLEAIALRAKLPLPTHIPPEHEPALANNHRLARNLTLHWSPKTQYGAFLRSCDLYAQGSSCLEFLRSRCVPGGLHLIDTPECMFPPQRQLGVLSLLKQLVDDNAQFIIATNSPLLLAFPDAQILDFDALEITPRTYDETPAVKFMREFLADPTEHVRKL